MPVDPVLQTERVACNKLARGCHHFQDLLLLKLCCFLWEHRCAPPGQTPGFISSPQRGTRMHLPIKITATANISIPTPPLTTPAPNKSLRIPCTAQLEFVKCSPESFLQFDGGKEHSPLLESRLLYRTESENSLCYPNRPGIQGFPAAHPRTGHWPLSSVQWPREH